MLRSVCTVVFAGLFTFGIPAGVSAQETESADDDSSMLLEEVMVTARKREESLQDVPVSISVVDDDFIKQVGMFDMFDLFENVPGIQYNQDHDRQGVRAAVRGVQAEAQNPVRAKVTSFIDGVPMLGQIGSLQFQGVERIEVMRGPQSAAFGRATFAGAINYVTKKPGDEIAGEVYVATSDLDRNIIAGSLSGPITDTLGFTVDASFDEYRGDDDWVTTDGRTLGKTSTEYLTAKLVWEPSNSFDMNLRVLHLETDDDPPLEWNLPKAERLSCTNFTLPNGQLYVQGAWNCDPSIPEGGAPQNAHPEETLTPGTPQYYQAQTFAVLEPGSYVKRDRAQGELNFSMANDSLIQVLVSYSEEELRRWFDVDRSAQVPRFMGTMIVGGFVRSRANPSEIEETYAEVRWVSPGDQPLRWVVGASYFDYTFNTLFWDQLAGELLGLEDEANGGNPFLPVGVNSDVATNIGIFGNLTWDVTDRTTLSAEVRFQEDDVTNVSEVTGFEANNTTTSWQPRLAINHALNEDWSVYGQLSSGTNPAGVNIDILNPETLASLAAAQAAGYISYGADFLLSFKEEQLTNLEVGIKGTAFENRLRLSAALYLMKWEDMIQPGTVDWDGPWNDGTYSNGRIFTVTSGGGFLNQGDADLSGIEVEANWLATDNWIFSGSLSHAKQEFADSCSVDPLAWGYEPTDFVEDGNVVTDCYRVDGNSLIRQPDTTIALSGTYMASLGVADWDWSARVGARYSSKEYIDVMNLAYLDSRTILDASLSFYNDNWNITLFGNNLTDDDTPRNLQYLRDWNFNDNILGFNIRPRTPAEYGIRLRYQF